MIEGMAAVVQRGIDEILSLRESNKQLLEALKRAYASSCNAYGIGHHYFPSELHEAIKQEIRRAEEQA